MINEFLRISWFGYVRNPRQFSTTSASTHFCFLSSRRTEFSVQRWCTALMCTLSVAVCCGPQCDTALDFVLSRKLPWNAYTGSILQANLNMYDGTNLLALHVGGSKFPPASVECIGLRRYFSDAVILTHLMFTSMHVRASGRALVNQNMSSMIITCRLSWFVVVLTSPQAAKYSKTFGRQRRCRCE